LQHYLGTRVETRLKKKLRKLSKAISTGLVPLPPNSAGKNVIEEMTDLDYSVKLRSYTPKLPVGYLGLEKRIGVTRFLPILAREDMLLYFATTYRLERFLFKKIVGVQGAYQSLPQELVSKDKTANVLDLFEIIDSLPYSVANMVDPSNWLNEWKEFIGFVKNAIDSTPSEFVILTSDIANFYDSINIDRLRDKLSVRLAELRATPEDFEQIDYLENYLRYYDRLLNGYRPSSKGLPQEYLSDASRLLSNFYLLAFDEKFKDYCVKEDILYTRFADDLILLGKDKDCLELALHKASRFLLREGLNLNASKTRFFTKQQYQLYRALDLIDAVGEKNQFRIACEIRKSRKHLKAGGKVRTDTISKRLLTALNKKEITYSWSIRRFIEDFATDPDKIRILGQTYIFRRAMLESDPNDFLNVYVASICSKPYAHPKADFLQLLRKFKTKLSNAGISKDQITLWIDQIEQSAKDSEVVTQFCVPSTKSFYKI